MFVWLFFLAAPFTSVLESARSTLLFRMEFVNFKLNRKSYVARSSQLRRLRTGEGGGSAGGHIYIFSQVGFHSQKTARQ